MPYVTRIASLLLFLGISSCYIISYPWDGELYDIDSVVNFRIPLPASGDCNLRSNANMSLQLAYVTGLISIAICLLMVVYNIAPRGQDINWPMSTLWLMSIFIFLAQLTVFVCISARVSVWFLSCSNPSKTSGSCPTTNFNLLVQPIRDKEMCHFAAEDLTLYNYNNDLFVSCQDSTTLLDYNRKFARWDVAAYYTAAALCVRNESSVLGQDLSWCYYWGCSRACSPEAYRMNWRFFSLDIIQLLGILFAYTFIMADFYVLKNIKEQ
ncbi:MAG: hypothetical protein CMH46_00285 [Muricauda sp.]|nr:hypothetical protein [Allomuricauda sp.]